jgi:uncharacterized repeat protein (TIGR04138 family)
MQDLEVGRVRDILRQDPRYAPEAYYFIFEALEYTLARIETHRHVKGPELLEGIRDYALERFGPLTRTVFNEWGIWRTEDFGEIVFNLVDADLLKKTNEDRPEDFREVYDFEDAFDRGFERRLRRQSLRLTPRPTVR